MSARQIMCRLRGHRWGWTYRDDGYPLNLCERCALTETWAGGMLMHSTNWAESERLDRRAAARVTP